MFRYRFVELYYTRASVRKGRTVPARRQTVVIFLPDVRSCLPTRLEWEELSVKYKKHLEMKTQSNDGEEVVDADKKQAIEGKSNDDSNNVDVEMADESNKSEQDTHNVGNENHDSTEPTTTKATQSSCGDDDVSSATPTISKALLNIISNFT